MPAPITASGDGKNAHAVYLEYLDKEMTIMGILSVFAVAAPAAILDKTLGAAPPSGGFYLWQSQRLAFGLGSFALFFAALLFYAQRSLLAFFYGQIALSTTPSAYDPPNASTQDFVHEADLWSTWRLYDTAFAFVLFGFWCCLSGIVAQQAPRWQHSMPAPIVGGFIVLAIVTIVRRLVFDRFKDQYDPWRRAWEWISRATRTTYRDIEEADKRPRDGD